MSFSYNLFPVAEIKKNHGGVEHFESFPMLGEGSIDYDEVGSRYPNLEELKEIISTDGMSIVENVQRDRENGIICESFQVIDSDFEIPNDVTVVYQDTGEKDAKINSIFGVKSELDFMVKLASRLTEKFGSMALSSPYEVIHVSKHLSYTENLVRIKKEA